MGLTFNLRRDRGNSRIEGLPPDTDAVWDSPETIDAVSRALAARGEVVPIEADARAYDRLREAQPDFVFNLAEGSGGPSRQGLIPSILELLDIPYLGSDPLTLGLCLHKAHAKEVLLAHALPTPPFWVVDAPPRREPPFGLPAVVKPLHEGAGKGIAASSLVRTFGELCREIGRVVSLYGQPAIVEKFLPGRELSALLLGNGEDLTVLPLVGVDFESLAVPILDFEARSLPVQAPARVPAELAFEVAELCKEAWRVLNLRDWGRMDLRLDERGRPNLLEVNAQPGLRGSPEIAALAPRLLEIGLRRCGVHAPREAVAPAVG